MNISNKLTFARIALTFVFMYFLFLDGLFAKVMALIVFMIAMGTDLLDGLFARRRNDVTEFGKFMDPIADKILVLSAFIAFVELRLVPAWMVLLILFRELTITGLRITALTRHIVIPASEGGKHKTASQMTAIMIILSSLIVKESALKAPYLWTPEIDHWFRNIIFILMLAVTILTLTSGLSYIYRNRYIFSNARKNN